jgi:RNA polymerase sigma-70 factor, ECF subfamily
MATGRVLWAVDDEGSIMERARHGDLAAFECLLSPLIEPACQLARAILTDWYEAEDAVQEAALRAWRAVARLREGTTTIRPWFFAIVANEARRRRRGRWRAFLPIADSWVGEQNGPEEQATLAVDLDRAMRRLGEKDRLILFLHFYLDLPLDEAGRIMGMSAEAAKSRLYRATRRLRPALSCVEIT